MSLKIALLACASISLSVLASGGDLATRPGQSSSSARSPYEWRGDVTPTLRSIGACLRESRAATGSGLANCVERLIGSGDDAAGALFEVLVQTRVPKVDGDDAPQKLSLPQRALVIAALSRLPAKTVRAVAEQRATDDTSKEYRLALVEVLGVVGEGEDLATLAARLPRDDEGALTRSSSDTLRAAYARILERHPRAFARASVIVMTGGADVAEEMLLALAQLRDRRALALCHRVAQSRKELAQTAVVLSPRFAGSNDVAVELEFAAWLRTSIDTSRTEWTRAVINALAVLDEGDAVPELIELLTSDATVLQRPALEALQKIGRVKLPADPARWQHWFDAEQLWFRSGRMYDRTHLAASDLAEVLEGFRAYTDRRVFRSVIVADLTPLLARPEPPVRELACATLGRIGSRAVLRELIEALDDPVAPVHDAAHAALEAITGVAIPPTANEARSQVLAED